MEISEIAKLTENNYDFRWDEWARANSRMSKITDFRAWSKMRSIYRHVTAQKPLL